MRNTGYDLRPMLHDKLPTVVRPKRLCHLGTHGAYQLSGQLLIKNMSSLNDKIIQDEIVVSLILSFGFDESGEYEVKVLGHSDVTLCCQRCIGPVECHISIESNLRPVSNDEQAKLLPANLEPLLAPEDEVDLESWVQEELLLALPMVPLHTNDCESWDNEFETEHSESKHSPFAQLKSQLER